MAQHSVYVSQNVPVEYGLAGLLHDAAEAFIGDIPTPLKSLLPDYMALEKRVEAAVLARFGLSPGIPDCVKMADAVLLATEKRDLMPEDDRRWEAIDHVAPMRVTIDPWTRSNARHVFLQHYGYFRKR